MIKVFQILNEDLVISWWRLLIVLALFVAIPWFLDHLSEKHKNKCNQDADVKKQKNTLLIECFTKCFESLRTLELRPVPQPGAEEVEYLALIDEVQREIESAYIHLDKEQYKCFNKVVDELKKKQSRSPSYSMEQLKTKMEEKKVE